MNQNDKDYDLQALRGKLTPRMIGIIIGGILLLIAVISSFYIVDPEEKAVVLQFGKYDRTAGPGLHIKMPFGIEKVYKVKTERNLLEEFGFRTQQAGVVSTYETGDFSSESYMLTGDLNIAEITWSIQYKIKDPKAYLFNTEDQQRTIRDISEAVINVLAGDLAVFDVVTTLRTRIQEQGKLMMNKYFEKYGLGAEVVEVKLQKTLYPKGEVQDAFEDVNKATQDRIRFVNEGKEAYNKEIPRARGEAQQTIREAEGYAAERVNIAKGDVSRFMAVFGEYKKNPQIIRMRLYYEMFEEVFSQAEYTDLIDKQLKNFVPFKSLSQTSSQPPAKKGDEK
jgi:modulator of FtsH protease HflK